MANLSYLADGWLELESDPGLFTLLIEDFGCKNIQVEEIYDLSKVSLIDGHVYGFIFLFKWTEERRSRHRQMFISNNTQSLATKSRTNSEHGGGTQAFAQEPYYVEDENLVNSIFFAHQIVPNSCASHALLSVLLNCNNIDLGDSLTRLKEMSLMMTPENKGLAISNLPEIARAHNSHASETEERNKQGQAKSNAFPRTSSGDSFHFISFVNIKNRVYELDGLKKFPIDHGPIAANESFSEKFRKIILERIPQQQQKENKMNLQLRKLQTDMNTAVNDDIRYSLMAVVPDRRKENQKRLKLLKSKRSMLQEIVANLIKPTKLPEPYETHNYSKYSASTDKPEELEANVNKFTVKDVNYGGKLAGSLAKENDSNYSSSNQFDEDDNSTDTCSECESSRFGDESSDEEHDGRIDSLYAFKFVPLKEQNNEQNCNQNSQTANQTGNQSTAKPTSVNSASNSSNSSSLTGCKTFTKAELVDFYCDYTVRDLLNVLKKIDQEISQCDHNIKEETEKRTKFYVDDSRRTHNYSEFITTYLLMITEQKKLHEFVEPKAGAVGATLAANPTNSRGPTDNERNCEDAPIQFFKEILTNYEDVLMNENDDDEQAAQASEQPNESNAAPSNSAAFNSVPDGKHSNGNGKPMSSNANGACSTATNAATSSRSSNGRPNGKSNGAPTANSSTAAPAVVDSDLDSQSKRKRRTSRFLMSKAPRKEKIK